MHLNFIFVMKHLPLINIGRGCFLHVIFTPLCNTVRYLIIVVQEIDFIALTDQSVMSCGTVNALNVIPSLSCNTLNTPFRLGLWRCFSVMFCILV